MEPGSLYGVAESNDDLELAYGPVAVNLVASVAERDMVDALAINCFFRIILNHVRLCRCLVLLGMYRDLKPLWGRRRRWESN